MSGPSNTDARYQPSWQMQRMTQSKKATNTFISTVTHTNVSLPSHTRGEIFIWHERERKEANICRLEMEIKSLLVFILVPPSSCFCILLAFSISLPHFRMGVHDWVNGLVSCKATAQKTRSFLPGLAYSTLDFPKRQLCLHLSWWSNAENKCKSGYIFLEHYQWKLSGKLKTGSELSNTAH